MILYHPAKFHDNRVINNTCFIVLKLGKKLYDQLPVRFGQFLQDHTFQYYMRTSEFLFSFVGLLFKIVRTFNNGCIQWITNWGIQARNRAVLVFPQKLLGNNSCYDFLEKKKVYFFVEERLAKNWIVNTDSTRIICLKY